MASADPADAPFARLLAEASSGKREALEALLPLVYDELRRQAAAYMRNERPGQTIQATALVHEAYLRLMKEPNTRWQNRAHFCAIAANSMRQILVQRARARHADKRGGKNAERITLDEGAIAGQAARHGSERDGGGVELPFEAHGQKGEADSGADVHGGLAAEGLQHEGGIGHRQDESDPREYEPGHMKDPRPDRGGVLANLRTSQRSVSRASPTDRTPTSAAPPAS